MGASNNDYSLQGSEVYLIRRESSVFMGLRSVWTSPTRDVEGDLWSNCSRARARARTTARDKRRN